MKLLIVGSRSVKNFDISPYISADTDLILTGGAVGIDTLAEKYADNHSISKLVLRPRYARYGKSAPLVRNRMLVDMADEILIIWDGISKGTAYTISYARKSGKHLQIITI